MKAILSSLHAEEETPMHIQASIIYMVSFSKPFGQHYAVGTLHLAIIRDPSVGLLGPTMQRARQW